MRASPQVLDSLNADLAKEHTAIYQYETHAAQLRDTMLAGAIRDIAREEMWHMDWLIEAIVDRGGTPSVFANVPFFSASFAESLRANVEAEIGALDHYRQTLAVVGGSEPDLIRLIERIMDDERHHEAQFEALVAEVSTAGDDAYRSTPEMDPAEMPAVAPLLAVEYEGLLQYLWNRWGSGDCEAAETFFELATNEMQHLHWIGEYFAGLGTPVPPQGVTERVAAVSDLPSALDRAQTYETGARAAISATAHAVSEEGLRDDLARVRFQHDYHRFVLDRMDGGA